MDYYDRDDTSFKLWSQIRDAINIAEANVDNENKEWVIQEMLKVLEWK